MKKGIIKKITNKVLILATCASLATGTILGFAGCKETNTNEAEVVRIETVEPGNADPIAELISKEGLLITKCNEELITTDLNECCFTDKEKTKYGFELEDIDEKLDTLFYQREIKTFTEFPNKTYIGYLNIKKEDVMNNQHIDEKNKEGFISIQEKPFSPSLKRTKDGVLYTFTYSCNGEELKKYINIYKKADDSYVCYEWILDEEDNCIYSPISEDRIAIGDILGKAISFDQVQAYEKELSIYDLNREISSIDGIDFKDFTENPEMKKEEDFKENKKEIYFEKNGNIYKNTLNEIGDVDDDRIMWQINDNSMESTYKKYITYSIQNNEDGGWTVNIYKQRHGKLFVFEQEFDKFGNSESEYSYNMYELSTEKEYMEAHEEKEGMTKL